MSGTTCQVAAIFSDAPFEVLKDKNKRLKENNRSKSHQHQQVFSSVKTCQKAFSSNEKRRRHYTVL